MKIYIIGGQTGEYSDRTEWVVKAFKDKEKAEVFVAMASAIAMEIFSKYKDDYSKYWSDFEATGKQASAVDPNFKMDYTGTNYFIYECELED